MVMMLRRVVLSGDDGGEGEGDSRGDDSGDDGGEGGGVAQCLHERRDVF